MLSRDNKVVDVTWESMIDFARRGKFEDALTSMCAVKDIKYKDVFGNDVAVDRELISIIFKYVHDDCKESICTSIASSTRGKEILGCRMGMSFNSWLHSITADGRFKHFPFITYENSCPVLVIKYNRAIKFEGDSFKICSSGQPYSYYSVGPYMHCADLTEDNRVINAKLAMLGLLATGSVLSEFNDLRRDAPELLVNFVLDTLHYLGVPHERYTLSDLIDELFDVYDKNIYATHCIRQDEAHEYVRVRPVSGYEFVLSVPLFDCMHKTYSVQFKHVWPVNDKWIPVFYSAALALCDIVVTDTHAYAMNEAKDRTFRTQKSMGLVDVQSRNDFYDMFKKVY